MTFIVFLIECSWHYIQLKREIIYMAKDLSYQRMFFIELLAWWKGRITNKDLQNQFNISRQQAYSDLKNYRESQPNNPKKDDPGYIPRENFNGIYISGDPSQFLHWFGTGLLSVQTTNSLHLEYLALPSSRISVKVIRALVNAIEKKQRIEAGYVSLSNPENDGRIFHPHTFVNTGARWHVRGFCEKSQGYRDLVLSRFRENTELLDGIYISNKQDLAWQSHIDITLQPDPRLTQQQKDVLAHDYELTDGLLVIKTRAALANYLLQEMQIKTKMLDGTPEAQQWILVNKGDIKDWLY